MRKRLASVAVPAVIFLASLGAGCADQPQQAGQAQVAQSPPVAAAAPVVPAAFNDENPLVCEYLVPAGTTAHKWICFTASQTAPSAAAGDDPVKCYYVIPTGTMTHKWSCISASDEVLQRQRGEWMNTSLQP